MIGETNSSAKQDSEYVVVETFSDIFDDVTITANNYYVSDSFVAYKAGYTPVGIVGVALANASNSGSNVSKISINSFSVNPESGLVYLRVINMSTSTAKIRCSYIRVLYVRNS